MTKKRKLTFQYDSLPTIGKISLWLSKKKIIPHLINGSWVDILSGYKSSLQHSQKNNPKITQFYSLDHKLDKRLQNYGFHLKNYYVENKLPYKPSMFNNITIINGLEHLWKPQQILSECYRILKPDGRLQIIVPTWTAKFFLEILAYKLKNKQALTEINDHKLYFDKKILWPMLVKAGFLPSNITIKNAKFFLSLHAIAVKK